MEPGESSYSAERRRFPVAFLAGAIVMALLFGGFYLLTRILGSHGPSVAVKLPFGAAEQAYADQLRLLTDAAPIGIFQTDAEGRYVQTNPRWTEISGISAREAHGQDWGSLIASPGFKRARMRKPSTS